jgi:signal transduction histidine kinase/DNA-binding LacI/PurR family transcriptional regulator
MKIGLFLNNLDEEFQISVYKGIRAEAESLNMDLVCVQGETLRNYEDGQDPAAPFPSRELIAADGILLLSSAILDHRDVTMPPDLKRIIRVPLVSIGARLLDYPAIIIRNRKSMELLMEHLICFHGYRNLLYLGGPVEHPDNMIREHVFRRSINTLVNQFPDLKGTVINGEFHKTSAMMLIRDYIAAHPGNPPDAIVAASDNIAIGVLETLRTSDDPRRHNCPVTGFDDIAQARLEIPSLTTINQPLDALGRRAVRTLYKLLRGEKVSPVVYVESELRIRQSCGCTKEVPMENETAPHPDLPAHRSLRSEYDLRNVSILGQNLVTVNSHTEMIPHLEFFLINLAVKTFYLILYPEPLKQIGRTGNLVYRHTADGDGPPEYPRQENCPVDIAGFFTQRDNSGVPHSQCLYYLRSGQEYLGLIIYEAPDTAHPQICSAAIFIANTVKRLLIHDDETERARQLEQEVAFRTRDLRDTYGKLQEEQQRRLAVEAEVLRISELERLRFSMDLHDDICQRLAGISMFCKSLIGGMSPASFLPELSDLIDETLQRTRRYAHDSFPMELDTLGLKEALSALCHSVSKQTTCRCEYTWSVPRSPLTPAQDINIYRIIQEALQNAVKHSHATRINVNVNAVEDAGHPALVFSVQDNGTGTIVPGTTGENPILPAGKRSGLGLRSMRYRANQLGAEYRFESAPALPTGS